jgi:uncharacterized protein YjbI with pentapeptide repeats
VRETLTLEGVNLKYPLLDGANLSGADLRKADLSGAKASNEQRDQANSLQGATMPDGSKHP